MCFFFANIFNGWFFERSNSEKRKQEKKNSDSGSLKTSIEDANNRRKQYESNLLLANPETEKSKLIEDIKFIKEETDKSHSKKVVANYNSCSLGNIMSPSSSSATINNPNQETRADIESQRFRIRASTRRHLDFDSEYDLSDVNAKNRSKWTGPFHFIQAADSQFGMIDSYIHKRVEPGWSEEIELCQQLVSICNRMQPKPLFMVICGDLADAWPNTEIRRQQVGDFKRIFANLDPQIPLVCVCGNHDVGDEPTLESINEYRRTFGDDYFYFTKNEVLFIVINSQFYQNRDHVQDYARVQDHWLESILAKCRLFKYSIVFEHIPWFLKHSDEENDYFNIKKDVRLSWLKKFKDAGVTKIMCGHYHRNAGGWYDGMELIVTSAIGAQIGEDRSGVRIVRVLEDSIEHQYYAMQDIPENISLS